MAYKKLDSRVSGFENLSGLTLNSFLLSQVCFRADNFSLNLKKSEPEKKHFGRDCKSRQANILL